MSQTAKIRVLIADDHPRVRQALRAFLEAHDDLQVIGEATDGNQALELAVSLCPDVLLLDLGLPLRDGLQVLGELSRRGNPPRTLVLSGSCGPEQEMTAHRFGAAACLAKGESPDSLVRAIRGLGARVSSDRAG